VPVMVTDVPIEPDPGLTAEMAGACFVWFPLDDCEQPDTTSKRQAKNRVALSAQSLAKAVFSNKLSSQDQPEGAAVEIVLG